MSGLTVAQLRERRSAQIALATVHYLAALELARAVDLLRVLERAGRVTGEDVYRVRCAEAAWSGKPRPGHNMIRSLVPRQR